jgi:hypothetical protein
MKLILILNAHFKLLDLLDLDPNNSNDHYDEEKENPLIPLVSFRLVKCHRDKKQIDNQEHASGHSRWKHQGKCANKKDVPNLKGIVQKVLELLAETSWLPDIQIHKLVITLNHRKLDARIDATNPQSESIFNLIYF